MKISKICCILCFVIFFISGCTTQSSQEPTNETAVIEPQIVKVPANVQVYENNDIVNSMIFYRTILQPMCDAFNKTTQAWDYCYSARIVDTRNAGVCICHPKYNLPPISYWSDERQKIAENAEFYWKQKYWVDIRLTGTGNHNCEEYSNTTRDFERLNPEFSCVSGCEIGFPSCWAEGKNYKIENSG